MGGSHSKVPQRCIAKPQAQRTQTDTESGRPTSPNARLGAVFFRQTIDNVSRSMLPNFLPKQSRGMSPLRRFFRYHK